MRRERQIVANEEDEKVATDHSAALASIAAAHTEIAEAGETKKRVLSETEQARKEAADARLDASKAAQELKDIKKRQEDALAGFEAFKSDIEAKKIALTASLPDVDKALADLEAKKQPIRDEIQRLSNIQLDSQSSLAEFNVKVQRAKDELGKVQIDLAADNAEIAVLAPKISQAKIDLAELEEKNRELATITAGIDTRRGILFSVNKDLMDAENKLIGTNAEIEKARKDLEGVAMEKAAENAKADERMKALSSLEARVDAKIEIFKQYKDKFTVDELAKMKVNPDL